MACRASLRAALLVAAALTLPARAGMFDDEEARARIEALKGEHAELVKRVEGINRNQVDFANQIEAVKAELAKLRGQIEVLTYELEATQKRQKDFYVDLDSRLRKLETAPPPEAKPEAPKVDPAQETKDYEAALASLKALKYKEAAGVCAYVRARAAQQGQFEVQQMGVERQGEDSWENFVRRLQALGLKGGAVHVMLRPEQYQLLQIDAPPVAPEELRAAARFQIREMGNVHIDDITLDVMQVGDGQQKGTSHLFVVAAKNEIVRKVIALGDALNWKIPVIDIQETAQRNLQSALARVDGRLERADAALLISDESQAVLTISANEELFFTRRLDLPNGRRSPAA